MKDPAPQGDEQTRNQNVQDATNPEAPKVKSEKECMCWALVSMVQYKTFIDNICNWCSGT